MADRFPSIEEFDSGATGSRDLLDGSNSGTGGNLRDRERAALGEDADLFATEEDAVPSATVADGDDEDDLMGGGGGDAGYTNGDDEEMGKFESSFPAIDTSNERVAPGGTITGTAPSAFTPQPATAYPPEEEPEVVKQWRSRRAEQIAAREEAADKRKAETVKAAQESIDDFYENYNNKKEKGVSATRKDAEDFLKNREDTSAGGTSWQRIAKLVDVKGPAKPAAGAQATGKERFRELLGNLVNDENAPGAKGY